jgi:hypothetical protein
VLALIHPQYTHPYLCAETPSPHSSPIGSGRSSTTSYPPSRVWATVTRIGARVWGPSVLAGISRPEIALARVAAVRGRST